LALQAFYSCRAILGHLLINNLQRSFRDLYDRPACSPPRRRGAAARAAPAAAVHAHEDPDAMSSSGFSHHTRRIYHSHLRKTPSWPRSWANFSLLSLYSNKHARVYIFWANLCIAPFSLHDHVRLRWHSHLQLHLHLHLHHGDHAPPAPTSTLGPPPAPAPPSPSLGLRSPAPVSRGVGTSHS
jgi:hypothetical protein